MEKYAVSPQASDIVGDCLGSEPSGSRIPTVIGRLSNSFEEKIRMKDPDLRTAVAWLVTAAGVSIFMAIQIFTYLNSQHAPGNVTPAITFSSVQITMISTYYGCWVIPPLLALSTSNRARWGTLIFGGLLVFLNTLGGVVDGIRDGYNLIIVAILAITLPGLIAMLLSWRNVRSVSI
jgi:hypothetical protein